MFLHFWDWVWWLRKWYFQFLAFFKVQPSQLGPWSLLLITLCFASFFLHFQPWESQAGDSPIPHRSFSVSGNTNFCYIAIGSKTKKMLKMCFRIWYRSVCVLNLNVNVAKLLSHYTSCRNPSLIRVSSGTQKALWKICRTENIIEHRKYAS